ncbi:MAG: hypothetical protein COY81_04720 [Candidatus Pacebacteria bacterium CG_4_10_14_0_8_um_filter_43_12]|nr:MAG: hypothetical protein COY81_04720 [Candidatus Pacebacteria bacterium CG_4_10_14_0_8_um_filter_43_12]
MVQTDTVRFTKKSVTCFLHCGDDYLFIHRTKKGNDTDAGKLNGIGGKLEYGENYLACAVREIKEETGYVVAAAECQLVGLVNMVGGYQDDWVMAFFTAEVASKIIPLGNENGEGQLMWINKRDVLKTKYELVDDLHYCWDDICNSQQTFFAGAVVDKSEKIKKWSIVKQKK